MCKGEWKKIRKQIFDVRFTSVAKRGMLYNEGTNVLVMEA
jgi:hypothetical protein